MPDVDPFAGLASPVAQADAFAGVASPVTAAPQPAASSTAAQPGIMDQLNAALQARRNQFQDAAVQKDVGNQGSISTGLQQLGAGAGLVNDVAGVAFNKIGQGVSSLFPDAVKQGIGDAAVNVYNTVADSPVGTALGSVSQAAGQLAAQHPEAAANLGAAGNLAMALAPVKGGPAAVEAVADAAGPVANAARALDNVAAAPVKAAIAPIAESIATKTVAPTAEDLKGLASQAYQQADAAGGVLKPELTNQFVDTVQAMRPQTEAGQIVAGKSAFTDMANTVSQLKDKPLSLQAAQEVDEALGDAIDGEFQNGRLSKQGGKLLDIQTALRDHITNAPESMIDGGKAGFAALQDGRKLYSAAMKMGDVERILRRADNSQVPATAIKTGFKNLAEQARKRGYNADEIAAIDNAAKTGIATDALNVLGSRLGPIASGAAGFATGGPLGAAAAFGVNQATSSLARAGATALQTRRADAVAQAIANRAGVSKTVPRFNNQSLQAAFEAAKKARKQ